MDINPWINANIIAETEAITEKQWLEIRKIGIGGSDAGAVCGVNRWKSAMAVYLEKVGQLNLVEENEAIEWGKALEPIIKLKFQQRSGYRVEDVPYVLQHRKLPWMIANVDGIVEMEDGIGVLEVKNAGEFTRLEWEEDRLPDNYYIQLQHYLEVTGLEYGIIVCLLGGKKLVWKKVPRDEQVIKYIVDIEEQFWKDVQNRIMPQPTGTAGDKELLQKLFVNEKHNSSIELSSLQPQYDEYKDLIEQRKVIDKKIQYLKQQIMAAMGEYEVAYIGEGRITWKTVSRKKYVVKEKQYREFRIW
jgi:putative phage-type endonuclease